MAHQFDVVVERDSEGYFVALFRRYPAVIPKPNLLTSLSRSEAPSFASSARPIDRKLDFVGVQRVTVEA